MKSLNEKLDAAYKVVAMQETGLPLPPKNVARIQKLYLREGARIAIDYCIEYLTTGSSVGLPHERLKKLLMEFYQENPR